MKTLLSFLRIIIAVLLFQTVSYAGDKGESFAFIQLSDPQLGFFSDNKDFYRDSINLEIAVEQINRLRPAFVVVTGDMVNCEKDAAQKNCYRRMISRIDGSIPVWHVPGNHDIGQKATDEAVQRYIKEYGYDRFAFLYGGYAFIGIDSYIIKEGNVAMEMEQYKWLEARLEEVSQDALGIVVFSHYPVFIRNFEEKTGYSNFSPEDREKYWSLFKKYGVKTVIAGHLHDTVESAYDGIGMYTAGPVGRPLGNGYSGAAVWKVDPAAGTCSGKYLSLDELSRLSSL